MRSKPGLGERVSRLVALAICAVSGPTGAAPQPQAAPPALSGPGAQATPPALIGPGAQASPPALIGPGAQATPPALTAPGAQASRADLPPERAAVAAISGHPSVKSAAAGVAVEESNRDRLRAGAHELLVRGDAARRSVSGTDTAAAAGYNEWGISVERTLRLPGKATLDASLGEQLVNGAELAKGDALHEAGRLLLGSWIGWLREREQYALWRRQLDVLREQARVTERRLQAGDASRLDLELVEAAVSQAEAAAARAAGSEQAAAARLREEFPSLALPERVALLEPEPPTGKLEEWRERVVSESHELMFARARVERQRLVARRTDADRAPDPSVGLRLSSERSGAEHIAGVYVSIPIAGEARTASARAAWAQIEAAQQQADAVSRTVAAEAASVYTRAVGSYRAWRAARDAARRLERSAALVARGYELGETPLGDVLLARRAAIDGALAAASLLAEAAEARYRLLLDAHMLWPLDADDAHAAQGVTR